MSSFSAPKLDPLGPATLAYDALRAALPDWAPNAPWGLRTRSRGQWLHLAVVESVSKKAPQFGCGAMRWDAPVVIALEAPGGRTFHPTVESALARIGRVVA